MFLCGRLGWKHQITNTLVTVALPDEENDGDEDVDLVAE